MPTSNPWKLPENWRIEITHHAFQRALRRQIRPSQIVSLLNSALIVEEESDATPLPKLVLLSEMYGRPIHLVVGMDYPTATVYVITVYDPDEFLWADGYTRRLR